MDSATALLIKILALLAGTAALAAVFNPGRALRPWERLVTATASLLVAVAALTVALVSAP